MVENRCGNVNKVVAVFCLLILQANNLFYVMDIYTVSQSIFLSMHVAFKTLRQKTEGFSKAVVLITMYHLRHSAPS